MLLLCNLLFRLIKQLTIKLQLSDNDLNKTYYI